MEPKLKSESFAGSGQLTESPVSMMRKRPRSHNRQRTKATEANTPKTDTKSMLNDIVINRRGLQLQELNGSVAGLEDVSQRLDLVASRPEDFFQPNQQVAQVKMRRCIFRDVCTLQ